MTFICELVRSNVEPAHAPGVSSIVRRSSLDGLTQSDQQLTEIPFGCLVLTRMDSFMALRRPLTATLLGTALVATLLVTAPAVSSSAADISTSCGTAGTTSPSLSGKYASSICWIDFAGFSSTEARSAAGQKVTMQMGAYTATFTVHQEDVTGGWSARDVTAMPAQYTLGSGYYAGIPGSPVLYTSTGTPAAATTISIRDVAISLGTTAVTGYSLVSASAETPDAQINGAGEWTAWSSDQSISMIDRAYVGTGTGGCIVPLLGNGSTEVWCSPSAAVGGTYGAIVAAKSAKRMSATMYLNQGGEREGIALGIQTARVTLAKDVDGRVDPADAFGLTMTSTEGPVLTTAGTGTADEASTAKTIVIPTGAVTLNEAAASGSPSPLDYYDSDWDCSNATTGSTTTLPTGAGASKSVTPAIGDDILCTITNTALESELTLVKTASADTATVGDTLTYSFAVTNSGELPVSTLQIDEGDFNGSGTLGAVTCAASTLAVGASTTCSAPYTVATLDVSEQTLSNTATATALVTGTSAVADSALSTADVTITEPEIVQPEDPTDDPSEDPTDNVADEDDEESAGSILASTGLDGINALLLSSLVLLLVGSGIAVVAARRRRARQA